MFNFLKPRLIVGEALKITKNATTDSRVIEAIRKMDPYFWEGRFHTMEEYFKEGDYVLIYNDDEITVVPADEFFVYFTFTEDEVEDEFRPVRQIKPF